MPNHSTKQALNRLPILHERLVTVLLFCACPQRPLSFYPLKLYYTSQSTAEITENLLGTNTSHIFAIFF